MANAGRVVFVNFLKKKNNRNREEGPWLVCFEMLFFLRLISNIDLDSAACYSCTGTEEECGPTVSRDDVNDANKRVSIETCEDLQTHACWVRQGFAFLPLSIGLTKTSSIDVVHQVPFISLILMDQYFVVDYFCQTYRRFFSRKTSRVQGFTNYQR